MILSASQATDRAYLGSHAIIGGSFDPAHVGHVRALGSIMSQCGYMKIIVSLQTDDIVRQRKGSGRPVVPFGDRAEVLDGLELVYQVVENPHMDFGWLIRAVRPQFVATGIEYRESGIPEAGAVAEVGAGMIYTPRYGSSSEIIARMKNAQARNTR